MGLLRTVSPPPEPPAWREDRFADQKGVCHFLGSLTKEQSAAAKVTHDPQDGLWCPYSVFYPED